MEARTEIDSVANSGTVIQGLMEEANNFSVKPGYCASMQTFNQSSKWNFLRHAMFVFGCLWLQWHYIAT